MLAWQLITVDLKKTIRPTFIPEGYVQMQKTISKLSSNGERILTIPNTQGLSGYPFYDNISPQSSSTILDMAIPLSLPLADSTNYPDNYSNQFSSFAYNSFLNNYDTTYLAPLAVKYLLLDTSIISPQAEKDIATESAKMLLGNKDLSLYSRTKNLLLFKVINASSLMTTQKPIFAIGDFNTVNKIKKINQNLPVILLNQDVNSGLIDPSILKGENIFFDVKNPILTLTAESLISRYSVDILTPAWDWDKTYINYEPYKMRDIQQAGNLFTSGASVQSLPETGVLKVPVTNLKGKYHILIKALTVNSNTKFTIQIDNQKIDRYLNTNGKLIWQDLGIVTIDTPTNNIYLFSNKGISFIIDSLLLVPDQQLVKAESNISNILASMSPLNLNSLQKENAENNFSTSNFDFISVDKPTKYITYKFTWGEQWKATILQ